MTLTVVSGDVTGSFEASGSYTCDGIKIATSGSVHLTGSLDDQGLSLWFDFPATVTLLSTLACHVNQPVTIPVDGDTASERFRNVAPSADVYECDWRLERQDPPAA